MNKHKEALEAECIRAHNAGHEALCLSETVVCSIARTDLESLMSIAKLHGEALQAASWQPIETAPRDGTEIRLKLGEMTILGKWETDGFLDENCKECGGWFATREGEHPPCWSGGVCWASNGEESPSISPTHWMHAAPVDGGG